MYKTLTGITAKRFFTHLEEKNLLPAEQIGCHPGSKGCKDQLMISKAIYDDCKRRNKNLSVAWINYQKAFDSIPHSWLHLKTKQEVMQSQSIQIQRGIFQEASLSPLLFCVALIPLTNKLNRADCEYPVHRTERKISHLLYMDDLKLQGRNEDDLEIEIKIVKEISKTLI